MVGGAGPRHGAMSTDLDRNAHALRPFRVDEKRNRFVHYEASTFPVDPRAGCDTIMRRAAVCGPVVENGDGQLGVDVLNADGDIVQTFSVSRGVFEYLRRTLKFRREPTGERE